MPPGSLSSSEKDPQTSPSTGWAPSYHVSILWLSPQTRWMGWVNSCLLVTWTEDVCTGELWGHPLGLVHTHKRRKSQNKVSCLTEGSRASYDERQTIAWMKMEIPQALQALQFPVLATVVSGYSHYLGPPWNITCWRLQKCPYYSAAPPIGRWIFSPFLESGWTYELLLNLWITLTIFPRQKWNCMSFDSGSQELLF